MTKTTALTAAQAAALDALSAWSFTHSGQYIAAADLGHSGATLTALVRKGLAKTNSTWRSDLFSETTKYRATTDGLVAINRHKRAQQAAAGA